MARTQLLLCENSLDDAGRYQVLQTLGARAGGEGVGGRWAVSGIANAKGLKYSIDE